MFVMIMGLYFIGFAVVLNQVELTRQKSDIYLRWYATVKLVEEGRNIYDKRNSKEVDEIVYGRDSGLSSGFYYPAPLLIFTRPLAVLPYQAAHLLWTIFVQSAYLSALIIMSRFARWPATVNRQTLFIAAVIFSLPNLQHTIWGQFNTIGILSLALTYVALSRRRYRLAGMLAIGLTIKPQGQLLTLLFLFIWALSRRERWPFLTGFAGASFLFWLAAELMQPGWVFAFLTSLDAYIPVTSAIDRIWNPHQSVALVLSLGAVASFLWWRQAEASSPAFVGNLVLSLVTWMLIVPIIGMFHILVLPLAIILLMAVHQQITPRLYRFSNSTWVVIYLLGWIGFSIGLAWPEMYGDHIAWSEFVYKILLPLVIGGLALPLMVSGTHETTT